MTAKDSRLYGKLTLDFADSPKIALLSDKAFRTLVEMILWSRRLLTDGFIPVGISEKNWKKSAVIELTRNAKSPSLIVVDDGYMIHDFSEHQTTNSDLDAKREAGSKGGRAAKANRDAAAESVAPATAPAVAPATDYYQQNGSKRVATRAHAETETEKDLTTRAPAGADAPRKPPPAVAHALFEIAWLHWPKKADKKRAEEKFLLALRRYGGTPQELVDAITAHGDAFAATTPTHFVPGLPKWLAGDQWTDPLAVPDAPRRRLSRPEENYLGGRSGEELENLPDPFAPRGKPEPPLGEILMMRERS